MQAWLGLLALLSASASGEIAVDTIFLDRQELAVTEIFRIDRLALRDPHLFIEIEVLPGLVLCTDVTDEPIPGQNGFNQAIEQALNEDGDDDGLLDASVLMVLRPRGWPDAPGALQLAGGQCSAPAATSSCQIVEAAPSSWYDHAPSGLCRGALPATTRPYNPAVGEVDGPCFATHPGPAELSLDALILPLQAATVGGGWSELDNGRIAPALMRGFLTEQAADAIALPPELGDLGGQPLSALLPGGQGNCAAHSDLDQFNGQTGWWFYFDITAELTP